MKKISILMMMTVSMMASAMAFAAEGGEGHKHPCKEIENACVAAGFVKGGHKNGNKGLYLDCLGPILKGQTVQGVTVDASVVQACQARKEKHKEHREGKKS